MTEEIQRAIELLTNNGYLVTQKFDADLVRKQLEYKINLNEKLNEVTDLFDLKNRSRNTKLVSIRHYFCYFLRENFRFTFQDIGNLLGKDHATIIYSIRKHHEFSRYKDYKESIEDIKATMINLKNSLANG